MADETEVFFRGMPSAISKLLNALHYIRNFGDARHRAHYLARVETSMPDKQNLVDEDTTLFCELFWDVPVLCA
jgi:hypothetical protein